MTAGHRYFVVYKPYGMLSQFTPTRERPSLAALPGLPEDVYPVGRLDADSEGLLLLTDDGRLNRAVLHPSGRHGRTYLVQVEGEADAARLRRLESGVTINVNGRRHRTAPCKARAVKPPQWLPDRNPPVRYRKTVPDSWLELTLYEGKNRQVRRMTAAAGLPTLRLVRTHIESLSLEGMQPGETRELSRVEVFRRLRIR